MLSAVGVATGHARGTGWLSLCDHILGIDDDNMPRGTPPDIKITAQKIKDSFSG